MNVAYADLTKKISDAIESVASIKTLRIKNSSQDWFDNEIVNQSNQTERKKKEFF